MLPAVDVGATVLRQLAHASGVQVETVVFNVPAQSVWTPVFDALRDIPTVRALRFSGCDLADWDCRGLAAVAQLESLVRGLSLSNAGTGPLNNAVPGPGREQRDTWAC